MCPTSCVKMLQMCCSCEFVEAYQGSKLIPIGLGEGPEGFFIPKMKDSADGVKHKLDNEVFL